jgi:Flp pilus assembly pilin Flp
MKSWPLLVQTLLGRFVREDHGQDLIEYALLTGFISLTAGAAISTLSVGLAKLYTETGWRTVARSLSEQ